MLYLFASKQQLYYWIFLIINSVRCHNNHTLVTKLRELSANFTHNVLFEDDKLFMESVVLPNYACNSICPIAVLRPTSSYEVSQAVLIAQSLKLDISIRGGGHGYTCQATKDDSIMLDMHQMKQIQVDISNASSSSPTITLETGLTWFDVINYLDKDPVMTEIQSSIDKSYITVHGQCTSVGVAGFSLHGGVHFGGLSELYGLSSDNIRGLTAVLANSSIIELTSDSCIIDGSAITESSTVLSCQSLFYAFRGSGSSFGIVTSLTLQLYEKPALHTALSIVSVNLNNPVKAQAFLSYYLNALPENVSVTLFGLNAYFKAYLFVLKFARNKNKWQAINNDMISLFSNKINFNQNKLDLASPNEIHFIVESSWLSNNVETTGKSTEKEEDVDDETYQKLIRLHKSLNANKNDEINIATDKDSNPEQETLVREVAVVRDWIKSSQMWSVPSYDLVWGEGHSYGGATIIVDDVYEAQAIQASMKQYFTHLTNYTLLDSILGGVTVRTGDCDDCVAVLHRVGSGLRKIRHDSNSNYCNNKSEDDKNTAVFASSSSSSFNPFRHNASLWIEIDCGHFYRHRSTWHSHCSPFIDATQQALDESAPGLLHKAHYPNVPNLNTQDWQVQYYGDEGYKRLQAVKQEWDPSNVFSHAQSVRSNNNDNTNLKSILSNPFNVNYDTTSSSSICTSLYDKKANQQFYRILLVVFVTILCVILRGTMTAVSRRKKFNRFQWFFTATKSSSSIKKPKKSK